MGHFARTEGDPRADPRANVARHLSIVRGGDRMGDNRDGQADPIQSPDRASAIAARRDARRSRSADGDAFHDVPRRGSLAAAPMIALVVVGLWCLLVVA